MNGVSERIATWFLKLVARNKVKGIEHSNFKIPSKLLNQYFVSRADSADQDRIDDISIISCVRRIVFDRFRLQIADTSHKHKFIGGASVKIRGFVAGEPAEVGWLSPTAIRNQIGIARPTILPINRGTAPSGWMPPNRKIVHVGDFGRNFYPWLGISIFFKTRLHARQVECAPVGQLGVFLSWMETQPIKDIGKDSFRVWGPVVLLDVTNLHAEATKFGQDVGNVIID